ncbi:hypothetical protein SOM59_00775 [Pseudomonas coleopterorum]|uniref:P-loop ATPase, Sll1717 family n=1 Tax=Pseudomonas coleopterorum TaxID=1605838 RepID=UPI002A6A228C|nr:hypothetical protein [Pseudomonas coleopterorum]MDY1015610.1 hypothetical protein [Pseudomonas coleopterorum]
MNESVSIKEVLTSLDVGNSVAEFDQSLEKYFVENEAFHALVNDRADIIAGDKGTGKTAVYKILQKRYAILPELKGIEVIAGFNPSGNPIFQKLVQQEPLSEGQYASVWKTYFLSLIGNWLLEIADEDKTESMKQLDKLLIKTGLRSADDKPNTIFSKIVNTIQHVFKPKSAEMEMTLSETGIPIVISRLIFGQEEQPTKEATEVPHETSLRLLNTCLEEFDVKVWVALDRLDEAFQGFPEIEVPALRALMRSYLDLLEFDRFKLKLFVRRDLFRKIIGTGFVNLTHLNSRKKEIIWDEADLLNLLARRIRDGEKFSTQVEAKELTDETLFYKIFPPKVDQAERKPTTLNWVMSRIRDGNNVRPPRNLIDLVEMAREEQIRAESRSPRAYQNGTPLINSEAIRAAQARLSAQRVEDTLIAEAGAEIARSIDKFRRAKAEQSLDSIASILDLKGDELHKSLRQLVDIGFLEELRSTWKVPMLYREGLEVTQGKAFNNDTAPEEDE